MPRTHPTESLGNILPKVLKKMEPQTRPSLETVRKAWKDLAGGKAARHSWPRSLSRGNLLVEVENSGWMYTLSLQRVRLLEGLVKQLGSERIKELRFRIGELKDA